MTIEVRRESKSMNNKSAKEQSNARHGKVGRAGRSGQTLGDVLAENAGYFELYDGKNTMAKIAYHLL
jgi:hypothetical protein